MKRILYLSVTLFLSSCLSEKNVEPGKPSTFIRYFNGGNNDYAQVAEETSDGGIIILGTSKINLVDTDSSKVKLIKTDAYGNTEFQKVYPATFKSKQNLAANALLQLANGGFIVAGTDISTRKDLFLMEVNSQLDSVKRQKFDFTKDPYNIKEPVEARAIQLNKNGNYLVLASIQSDTYNMLLAEIDKNTWAINWVEKYGAGTSSLGHKLFLDATTPLPNVYWSGTVTRNSTDIRLVKTAQNSLNTIFDLPIGEPGFIEQGHDICQYGLLFVVVGSTNKKGSVVGDQDVLFKILNDKGTELFSKSITEYGNSEYGGGTDTGNAVCATTNGFVVLGSVNSKGQDDYFLMKYDGFGNDAWSAPRIFGNTKRNDAGASLRQLSDGSLLVLGTTVFGGVNTMMLMKANSEGDIE